jgi:hypothetical protein
MSIHVKTDRERIADYNCFFNALHVFFLQYNQLFLDFVDLNILIIG